MSKESFADLISSHLSELTVDVVIDALFNVNCPSLNYFTKAHYFYRNFQTFACDKFSK